MKIIFDTNDENSIFIDDITDNHLIVAIINNNPCILVQGDNNIYKFDIISNINGGSNLTRGNGYNYDGTTTTVKDIILQAKKHHPNCRIGVYEQNQWTGALKFLMENA